jgi:exopolyphosphatase / guanosine-5'-triphosphate,3'-diphosphate pyrophosphatase
MARVAAIDCGTNSIRLLVADVNRDGDRVNLRDVHRDMKIVRLGQGVDATGRLAPEAIDRTRAALAEYTAVLRRKGAERVRMVATSATRDAANVQDFFEMVRGTLGTDAEVITGDEEARLSFTGTVGDFDPSEGPFLVVDLGGGSTELVLGEWDGATATVTAARSVDIGCVRITERCLRSDPPTADEEAEAERVARAVLAGAFDAVPVEKARTWIGVAGTMTQLGSILQKLESHDPALVHLSRYSGAQLHEVAAELLGATHAERAANPVIHPGRIDVIGGGALIVRVLAEELRARAGIDELVVSEHDILDGIALSLA